MAEAKRYNEGKLRYELISKIANKEKAKVYTLGAHKYSLYEDENGNVIKGSDLSLYDISSYKLIDDGANNWKKGLKFTNVLDSLKRHIEAFAMGEDYDPDLGTLHLANAAWNIDVLLEQYTTHPELDNRINTFFNKRVALDIDGVLADYATAFCDYAGIEYSNKNWLFSYKWRDLHKELYSNKDFWVNLKPLISNTDLTFDPVAYVTNRHIPVEWCEEWLEKNGFPCANVHVVTESKVDILKSLKVDIFIDDWYENFVELNNAGIFTYLYDRPYNQKYNIGHRRLKTLSEITNK